MPQKGAEGDQGMSGMGAMTGDGGAAWSQQAAAAGPVSGDGDGPPNVDAAFKLQVEEGATVSATFPFFGDIAGGQLSFQIGDHITVRQLSKSRSPFLHRAFRRSERLPRGVFA